MEEKKDLTDKIRRLEDALGRLREPPAYYRGKWFVGRLNFAEEIRGTMALPEGVRICDVTLREADQTYFTQKEYVAMALALDEAGVSVIQFLRPGVEGKDAEDIKALKELGKRGLSAKLQLYGVNAEHEMDLAAEYGVDTISFTIFPLPEWQPIYASRRVIPGGSKIVDMARSVRDEDSLIEYLEQTAEAVKVRGMKPRPIANFFSMASLDFLKRCAQSCERVGAFALNLVDAAGNTGPAVFRYVVGELKKAAPGLAIGVHPHNDFGLATANALAGVEGGATQVDVTVNGVGERTGNATLAEVVMALEALYGIPTGIDMGKLTSLSRLFEEMANWPTPRNKPIVGDYAFTDSAETHSFLLQADPLLFTPIEPELVGNARRSHMGLKSGVHTLKMRLQELGIPPVAEEKLPELLAAIRAALRRRKRPMTDEEMRELCQ